MSPSNPNNFNEMISGGVGSHYNRLLLFLYSFYFGLKYFSWCPSFHFNVISNLICQSGTPLIDCNVNSVDMSNRTIWFIWSLTDGFYNGRYGLARKNEAYNKWYYMVHPHFRPPPSTISGFNPRLGLIPQL